MALLLFALLLIVPFLELWAVVAVASQIGIGSTLLLLVLISAMGVWLVRREGVVVWRRVNAEVQAGRAPAKQLVDGAMILLGGSLLIVPGFITDVIGLLLLLPPTRALLRPAVLAWIGRRRAVSGVVFSSTIGSDGRVRTTGQSFGSTGEAPFAEVIEVEVDEPRSIDPPS